MGQLMRTLRRRRVSRQRRDGYPTNVSGVALTFDDGPDPVWTPRLLDVLADLDARATFFPIASRAAAHPDLIARMQAAGHAIGLHCDQHVRHSDRDIAWLRHDTRTALERLAHVNVRPLFWRTPWGDTASWSARVAVEHELRLVGWTVDTHDWRGDRAEEMLDATQAGIEPGSIVLAHDGIGPGARRRDARETLRYAPLAAAHARRRGLRLKALV
jgi:peptidoglycan/xylan/chitin deacetylase (PgdA/CDA1 family)